MSQPLRVAFLWHFHQPYYEYEGEMFLPWVRLHAIKDYADIPHTFLGHPSVRHTVNLTPSLLEQIDMYLDGEEDKALRLSKKEVALLTMHEKEFIKNNFFTINERLLFKHEGYTRLWKIIFKGEGRPVHQDWLDLQVWYNLAWFGNWSRQHRMISYLIEKGRDFTEAEKQFVLDHQLTLLRQIRSTLIEGKKLDILDISYSPYYHPILPLLTGGRHGYDTGYQNGEAAEWHVREGKAKVEEFIGTRTSGAWPSEGSVSDEVLDLYIDNGAEWLATDEEILLGSDIDGTISPLSKYFPYVYSNAKGKICVFFRDRGLSDAIGFEYTDWDEAEAVNDFMGRLMGIKSLIIREKGEAALENAVVSVILDGENCWEYYRDNAKEFLEVFLGRLAKDKNLRTEHFSVIAKENGHPKINSIKAGSWINADFNIWAGDEEDIKAWKYLAEAYREYREVKGLDDEVDKSIEKDFRILEGSDWFWWFGPEHDARDRLAFDEIYRKRIGSVYKKAGLVPPAYLSERIMSETEAKRYGISDKEFEDIVRVFADEGASAVHRTGLYVDYGLSLKKKKMLVIRLKLSRPLHEGEIFEVYHLERYIVLEHQKAKSNIEHELKGGKELVFVTDPLVDPYIYVKINGHQTRYEIV